MVFFVEITNISVLIPLLPAINLISLIPVSTMPSISGFLFLFTLFNVFAIILATPLITDVAPRDNKYNLECSNAPGIAPGR